MSKTFPLLDGTVELFDRDEITRRRTLPYDVLLNQSDHLMVKLAHARRIVAPDGRVEENEALDGPEHRLTTHESETLEYMQLALNWSWLKAWTLDAPFPAKWEDLLDLPRRVVDALHAAVQAHANGRLPDVAPDFEPSAETLEDRDSFTGGSDASKTSSKAPAKRRSSTRKPSAS
ncbi:hypothetical protein [Arthrobacter sp. efr-133-TYG-118]|uniref:hypothetical protein n=1 Tax=Arthrobacter sp. efr-133-TYG-118 TaxID=3040279 RepID=UPI00254C615E|nr:hypothetical protein [Arthrobacter sp. efr-133-TYG-118]